MTTPHPRRLSTLALAALGLAALGLAQPPRVRPAAVPGLAGQAPAPARRGGPGRARPASPGVGAAGQPWPRGGPARRRDRVRPGSPPAQPAHAARFADPARTTPLPHAATMTRLHDELRRLYLPADTRLAADDPASQALVGADGSVRALVLELARPADWALLGRVWQGVQAELGWPAPGIAVSGRDGFQLWFSLQAAVPADTGAAALAALQARWLGDVDARRVQRWPRPAADGAPPQHAAPVPARQGDGGRWSAFVAPDLAPVFADEPWLDLPPSPEGQAELLARLRPVDPEDFARVLQALQPASAPAATPHGAAGVGTATAPMPAAPTGRPVPARPAGGGAWTDPRDFLRAVMDDDAAPLAQRIEAARALLADAAR